MFCLVVFNEFLREMKSASDNLQHIQLNASTACDVIANCRDYLQMKRGESAFQVLLNEAMNIARSHNLSLDITSSVGNLAFLKDLKAI